MAADFTKDPEYIKTRDQLDATTKRKSRWFNINLNTVIIGTALAVGAALELGALGLEAGTLGLGTPIAIAMAAGGAALLGYGYYAGRKYAEASKDAAMAQSEAAAQRTGYYVGKALEQQKENDVPSTKFQDMVNAQRAQSQAAGRTA